MVARIDLRRQCVSRSRICAAIADPYARLAHAMAKPTKADVRAALREYMRDLAAKGGKRGGKARALRLTAEQRRESARKAARARWAKV